MDYSLVVLFGIVWYIVVCCIVAWAARQRGYSEWGFLFAAVFLTPIMAVLVLIALPPRQKEKAQQQTSGRRE